MTAAMESTQANLMTLTAKNPKAAEILSKAWAEIGSAMMGGKKP
jgi:hypothetical protein